MILLSGNIGGTALIQLGFFGEMAISVSAIIGAVSVMMMIVISQRVQSHVILLIIGVMIGYIATAVIGVLKFFSNDEDVRAYVIWGLGSFSKVSDNLLSSDHRILMPAVTLTGASFALLCNLIARMPGFEGALPINSVTALIGASIVVSVLFGKRRHEINE